MLHTLCTKNVHFILNELYRKIYSVIINFVNQKFMSSRLFWVVYFGINISFSEISLKQICRVSHIQIPLIWNKRSNVKFNYENQYRCSFLVVVISFQKWYKELTMEQVMLRAKNSTPRELTGDNTIPDLVGNAWNSSAFQIERLGGRIV